MRVRRAARILRVVGRFLLAKSLLLQPHLALLRQLLELGMYGENLGVAHAAPLLQLGGQPGSRRRVREREMIEDRLEALGRVVDCKELLLAPRERLVKERDPVNVVILLHLGGRLEQLLRRFLEGGDERDHAGRLLWRRGRRDLRLRPARLIRRRLIRIARRLCLGALDRCGALLSARRLALVRRRRLRRRGRRLMPVIDELAAFDGRVPDEPLRLRLAHERRKVGGSRERPQQRLRWLEGVTQQLLLALAISLNLLSELERHGVAQRAVGRRALVLGGVRRLREAPLALRLQLDQLDVELVHSWAED